MLVFLPTVLRRNLVGLVLRLEEYPHTLAILAEADVLVEIIIACLLVLNGTLTMSRHIVFESPGI
jgi:hypothetical protein